MPMNISSQFETFPETLQKKLRACAAIDVRVAQLSKSFPLLFFSIATRRGELPERTEAVRRVVEGQKLSDVAAALGLPLCLRRIPLARIPASLPAVRWSPGANRLLEPFVPHRLADCGHWLTAVTFAHAAAGEPFALWLARRRRGYLVPGLERATILALGVHAWASLEGGLGHLVPHQNLAWSPEIGLGEEIWRAGVFLRGVLIDVELGPEGLKDSWLPRGTAGRYGIVPILTGHDLVEEASAMQNCVHGYSSLMAANCSRLFSVRQGPARVATLEVRFSPEDGRIVLNDIKGVGNTECPIDVLDPVLAYIGRHGGRTPRPPLDPGDMELHMKGALGTYWGSSPWRRERASAMTVQWLRDAVRHLKRLGRTGRRAASGRV